MCDGHHKSYVHYDYQREVLTKDGDAARRLVEGLKLDIRRTVEVKGRGWTVTLQGNTAYRPFRPTPVSILEANVLATVIARGPHIDLPVVLGYLARECHLLQQDIGTVHFREVLCTIVWKTVRRGLQRDTLIAIAGWHDPWDKVRSNRWGHTIRKYAFQPSGMHALEVKNLHLPNVSAARALLGTPHPRRAPAVAMTVGKGTMNFDKLKRDVDSLLAISNALADLKSVHDLVVLNKALTRQVFLQAREIAQLSGVVAKLAEQVGGLISPQGGQPAKEGIKSKLSQEERSELEELDLRSREDDFLSAFDPLLELNCEDVLLGGVAPQRGAQNDRLTGDNASAAAGLQR